MGIDSSFLRRVALFETLHDDELRALSERLIERRFERGQIVFTEDEVGDYMYIVREGRVKVSRWLPDGREVILAFRGSADFFGEMSLLDGQSPPATVTAVSRAAMSFAGSPALPCWAAGPWAGAACRAGSGRTW